MANNATTMVGTATEMEVLMRLHDPKTCRFCKEERMDATWQADVDRGLTRSAILMGLLLALAFRSGWLVRGWMVR